ncbi:MAG: hypothetical protein HY247_05690 [archaeon]|nr:MAG: hypothetical protein HY247_05690 [archaeon]
MVERTLLQNKKTSLLIIAVVGGLIIVAAAAQYYPTLAGYLGRNSPATNSGGGNLVLVSKECAPEPRVPANENGSQVSFEVLAGSPPTQTTTVVEYSTATVGSGTATASPGGFSVLSTGQSVEIHWNQLVLTGSYQVADGGVVAACGIAYCEGASCTPSTGLTTDNENVTTVYTQTSCLEVCYVPHTTTTLGLKALSPVLQVGTPYTFAFYAVDGTGKAAVWTLTVTFVGNQ